MRNKFPVVALSMICLSAILAVPDQAKAGWGHGHHHHGWHNHYWNPPPVLYERYYYYAPPPPPVPVYEYHYYEPPRYVAPYVVNPLGNGLRFSIDFSRQF